MSGLSEALDATRVDETRRAARALLRRPLLRAAGKDADEFTLVRKHAGDLRTWFDRNTGWRLLVDSEVARLVKSAAGTDDHTCPARDVRTRIPFGRRRYVLTCLALAALERAEAQITLGRLAEQIVLAAADPDLAEAGVVFTLDNRDERGDLVAVVRLLLDLGVLSRVAGDEESFVKDSGDVLYDVERRVLATLLATPRGPSTVDERDFEARLAAVTRELEPTTDELRNRMLRHRLTRLLLETPVLYYDELNDAEVAYLTSQRAAITARITELTGLVAEVRAEGVAMVDPSDDLTDVRMPDSGTDGHVTLLLAEFLAARNGEPVGETELHAQVRSFAERHRSYWRRTATEPGAEIELTALALARLEALRLIRRDGGSVVGRPALARYAVTEPVIHDPNGPSA
ncbi:MAG TPA: TIGR02678 family protein [Actinophytocola sp.]|uniref:TIGR02678 family protein n=1 Tax=Actinophytocola sp. TaxID=1872138 RepID=UPI002DDCF534|nr:TIGR02678 family protein [Actinophytocola sp.]HEV2782668.1 TIGR02678 family protein [Actinophytocola sp.]